MFQSDTHYGCECDHSIQLIIFLVWKVLFSSDGGLLSCSFYINLILPMNTMCTGTWYLSQIPNVMTVDVTSIIAYWMRGWTKMPSSCDLYYTLIYAFISIYHFVYIFLFLFLGNIEDINMMYFKITLFSYFII